MKLKWNYIFQFPRRWAIPYSLQNFDWLIGSRDSSDGRISGNWLSVLIRAESIIALWVWNNIPAKIREILSFKRFKERRKRTWGAEDAKEKQTDRSSWSVICVLALVCVSAWADVNIRFKSINLEIRRLVHVCVSHGKCELVWVCATRITYVITKM